MPQHPLQHLDRSIPVTPRKDSVMHLNTTSRRTAGALATTALAAIITVTPAHARQDPGPMLRDGGTGLTTSDGSVTVPGPAALTVDDGAVEYLQIALGVIGGMVVVGAVATGASRRRHGHAHLA
ncbi:hypothetical protein LL946_01285 [Knoellia locipacati]|uniref:hypothetical protein n=1 Tax=Knoellia locipacati TaxID=882824 RepID=UPI0038510A1E